MESRWTDAGAAAMPEYEGLLYASRLVGADQDLVLWGGGNTSAKLVAADFRGRQVPVLRVKGSGSDLQSMQPQDFPAVRLDDVLPLRERDAMADDEMVAYLAHTLLEPSSPRPSIETLLHAFLPARFVVHTHADAIVALTNTPHGRQWVREALGPDALWLPYRRPGFTLSKLTAAAYDAQPDAACAVLEKHGLITWGATAREAYERTIQVVSRTEAFVREKTSPPGPLSAGAERGNGNRQDGGVQPLSTWWRGAGEFAARSGPDPGEGRGEVLDAAARRRVYLALAPLLRGLAARTTPAGELLPAASAQQPLELDARARVVLRFDDSADVLGFASDPAAEELSQVGPATPDHLITTRRTALYVPVSATAGAPLTPQPPLPQGERGSSATKVARHSHFPSVGDGNDAQAAPPSFLSPLVGEGPGVRGRRSPLPGVGEGLGVRGPTAGETLASLQATLEPAWRAWVQTCVDYVRQGSPNTPAPDAEQVDVRPRVVLLPEVGMVTLGRDAGAARQAADVYRHTIRTIRDAAAVERYASLSAQDCFDVEFWPLERYKLTLAPPELELSRRIALITGAAGGIGRAIAERFAAEGAHLCICDVNQESAQALAAQLNERHGAGRAIAVPANVADEHEVAAAFQRTVEAFGGLDILVSNAGIAPFSSIDETSLADWQRAVDVNATGHFLVVREALRLFKRQGIGGNVICVATKNVMAPGKEFGAYSASKSAQTQLARVAALEGGEHGIRVNLINPDAVFRGSTLWSPELRRARAQAHGVPEEELGDFYRRRCLLGVPIFPEDVAEAAWWLATDRTRKLSGGVITVDGGVPAAFPR